MNRTVFLLTTLLFLSCNDQEFIQEKSSRTDSEILELADKLTDEGANKKAIEILLKIETPTTESEYLLGFALLELKDYDSAVYIFKKIYKESPNYRNTCFNLSLCLLKKTNWDHASKETVITCLKTINYLTEGIKYQTGKISNYDLSRYHATRGQMFQLNSNFQEALDDFNTAINLAPVGDYYSRRAMTYHFMGKDSLACEDFKKGAALGETYVTEEINKICPK